jgi:type IV pilus assembly protein PilB
MVVFCKRCGSPVKLDNARLADPAYNVKCQQCQRPVAMDTVRPGAHRSAPGPGAAAPPAGTPAAGTAGSAAARAAEEHAQALDRNHYLQKIRLFSGLPYEECLLMESRLRPREFAPKQTIVKEGGPGDAMFFITSGAVEVRKKDPNTGIDFLLSELKAGSCFGEMALLTGKPRVASVVAVEPTSCSVLEQTAFDEVLLTSSKVGLAMSRVLAERLDETNQQTGIEYINLAKLHFDPMVIKLLPQQMMQQHRVLPVAFSNNRLTLAMVNPSNIVALDDVRRVIKGVIIEPVVTSEDDFKRFITKTYVDMMRKEEETQAREQGSATLKSTPPVKVVESESPAPKPGSTESILESLQSEALKSLEIDEGPQSPDSVTDLSHSAEDAPIIRLANGILSEAIRKGASDIHVEPQEKELAVRFRIDGALQVVQVLPKKFQMGLISRLKILSKLDIAEKRLPQDGRISVRLEERPIDFRVSTIPSKWGEKICMRILDKSNTLLGLDKLILLPEVLKLVREMISQPYGIVYVTGPTGSGKTTTLYSALAELNAPDVNISTAEDPIEYDLPQINQVQTHKEIGLDFARILRAFLRQDPDIILVGETRDKETAHIAVEAALTGHLVFTTLHTNDAAGAFTRLGEMGVEPFLMSSSTIGVIAQRLTRRLCQACKESYTPDDISLKYMGLDPSKPLTFYRHKGCDKCSETGYRGRVGVYEVLRLNAELRRLVAGGGSSEAIAALAIKNGMKTLKDYTVWLLQNGWTTMEEVLQVVSVRE